jgi:hypothetical protein
MKLFVQRRPIPLRYENIDLLWNQVPDVGVEALIAFPAMIESDQNSVDSRDSVKLQNQIQTNRLIKNRNLLEGRRRL